MARFNLRRLARSHADRLKRRDDGIDFKSYRTVFDFLIAQDRRRIFKALDAGFDVNRPDRWGFLILHRACVNRMPDVVSALIERGSSLEAEATAKWRPLHMAALGNARGCPAILVGAGALIDARDASGNTALHLAASMRQVEMVRELLAVGADPEALNDAQQTPADRARKSDLEIHGDRLPELMALLE